MVAKGRGLLWSRSSVRRSAWGRIPVEVVEGLANEFGVDDEGENFHPGPAAGTIQGVDLVRHGR